MESTVGLPEDLRLGRRRASSVTGGISNSVAAEAAQIRLPQRRRAAFIAIAIAFLGLTVYQFGYPVYSMFSGRQTALGFVVQVLMLLTLGALHVAVLIRLIRRRGRGKVLPVLSIIGLAGYLAMPAIFGMWWTSLVMFPIFDVLMTARGRLRVTAIAVASVTFFSVSFALVPRASWLSFFVEFVSVTLIYLSGPALLLLIRELDQSRAERAAYAVGQERLRVARDLHDTLGHSLSVAHLKLELAERIFDRDTVRARAEVSEARALLRASMGEMQGVVAGLRGFSLRAETEGAADILRAAGLDVEIDLDDDAVSEQVAEAMAWVVREGTTNLLRHSDAISCRIEFRRRGDRAELLFANDGPPLPRPRTPSGGHGLIGLRERLTELGGELSVRTPLGGGFVLLASAPRWADIGASL